MDTIAGTSPINAASTNSSDSRKATSSATFTPISCSKTDAGFVPAAPAIEDRAPTKTRHRSATQAQLDLDQSLANLRTDYLDLYQIHNVINAEDLEFIFGKNGVMEMVGRARKTGKIAPIEAD